MASTARQSVLPDHGFLAVMIVGALFLAASIGVCALSAPTSWVAVGVLFVIAISCLSWVVWVTSRMLDEAPGSSDS
jgi:hypothetical protein